MLEKRHVQIITDVLKELASAGIDKLADAYLPVETEKRKRTTPRPRGYFGGSYCKTPINDKSF